MTDSQAAATLSFVEFTLSNIILTQSLVQLKDFSSWFKSAVCTGEFIRHEKYYLSPYPVPICYLRYSYEHACQNPRRQENETGVSERIQPCRVACDFLKKVWQIKTVYWYFYRVFSLHFFTILLSDSNIMLYSDDAFCAVGRIPCTIALFRLQNVFNYVTKKCLLNSSAQLHVRYGV